MPRINITKTSIYCDDCGKEIKDSNKQPYCEIEFNGTTKKVLKFHHECAVAFYKDLRMNLIKSNLINEVE